MSKTKLLLDVVENLRSLADSIQDLHDGMLEVPPVDVEKEKAEVKQETLKVTLEEVRGLLAKKSQAGKTAEVRKLIQSLGAAKLSDVAESDYAELFKKAEGL